MTNRAHVVQVQVATQHYVVVALADHRDREAVARIFVSGCNDAIVACLNSYT